MFDKTKRAIIRELLELKDGQWQRRDGLRCSRRCLDASEWSFVWSLRLLRWAGVVKKRRFPGHSIWASCNALPFYRLSP